MPDGSAAPMAETPHSFKLPSLDGRARHRLAALLDELETAADVVLGRPGAFRAIVLHSLKAQHGISSSRGDAPPIRMHFDWLADDERPFLLSVISENVRRLHPLSGTDARSILAKERLMKRPQFEARLNEILKQAGLDDYLQDATWYHGRDAEADELLRVLLSDVGDEMAGCKQGDVQQEMVASSIQSRLSRPGSLIVDYGAGLGRVGEGLSTASLFGSARYLAVDTPISDRLRIALAKLGTQAEAMERQAFLEGDILADVIVVVNTLHHVPFRELGRDLACLLRHLKADGELLIHEMGRLPLPEKVNVPWMTEDVTRLFVGIDGLVVNSRSTTTRGKGLPLTHTIVTPTRELPGSLPAVLEANARAVWSQMKARHVEKIGSLLNAGRAADVVELREALITNANLDLNSPSGEPWY